MATKKDVEQAYKSGYETGLQQGEARGRNHVKIVEEMQLRRVEALTKFVSVAGQSLQTQAEFLKGMYSVVDEMMRGSR